MKGMNEVPGWECEGPMLIEVAGALPNVSNVAGTAASTPAFLSAAADMVLGDDMQNVLDQIGM